MTDLDSRRLLLRASIYLLGGDGPRAPRSASPENNLETRPPACGAGTDAPLRLARFRGRAARTRRPRER